MTQSTMRELLIQPTDFDYMAEPERSRITELQAKMLELLPTQRWLHIDALWQAAATALGNEDERYCRIYLCENCSRLYHGDYSTNQAEDRDFCGYQCQVEAGAAEEEEDFGADIYDDPEAEKIQNWEEEDLER